MNVSFLHLKRALRAALLVLLLSVVGMTKANAQTGALNGLFSVNDSTQVRFSQGNLQYQASTNTWQFAENQWNYVGEANSNISETYDGWIDLFGWGTSGYDHGAVCYQPWSTSWDPNNYCAYGLEWLYNLYDQTGQADWGYNAISNGGNAENSGWRTLTREEWDYVFNTRNTTSGIRWAQGSVNGVNGIIILPDNWTASIYVLNNPNGGDYSSNIITAEDWINVLEANGAVFLPASGYRYEDEWGGGLQALGEMGLYWSSSTANSSWYAYSRIFGNGVYEGWDYYRYLGLSVRLVHSFVVKVTSNPVEGGVVSGGGAYTEGTTCTLTATAYPGYTFANWTENSEVVSTEATHSFTVTSNRSLVANFIYEVSVVVMPEEGGTVSGVGMDETDSLDVNYNFNNGLQGWTTIDADGDGNDWYYLNGYVRSHSWRNNVVLYPDNYLVSPWVVLGGSITFKARAGDSVYAAEHFGVAVSTTGTNASDFTMIQEWTMSAKSVGNWYEYMVDLGSFSGMGYVAIRHFNCSDMFTLDVDDVVITAPSSITQYTGGYEEGQTCTLTAVPNNGWAFNNWIENDGVEVSTEPIYSFTVTEGVTLVANFVENSTHWLPNTTDYEENMPVTAVVEIDGVEQQSATLELGAFSGEECRGSQTPLYFGPAQRYVYQMTVFGEEGDEIAFRLYDHATNEELELVAPEPVAFDILGYGTLPNPVVLNFRHSYAITATANPEEGGTVNGGGTYIHGETCTLTATPNDGYVFVHWTLDGEVVSTEAEYTFEVTSAGEYTAHFNLVQTTTFNQGWNWWSSYVELNGSYGLEALENGLDANGVMIKSQNDGYVSYSEELGWYGSLVELYNEQSYRVKADAACTVQLQGSLTNPADHPVTLNPGWTWMGFPWNQAMSVEAALEGFEPEANDFIKGRNAYTMYYAENGYSMWFGPLNSLEPGQGYVYYSNSDEAKTLTFNTNGGRSAQPNVTADDNLFRPETGNYADNMTLTAVVSLNGKELRSEDYEVAAFCNGECRGSAKLAYFAPKDSYVAFLTLYGNDGDELEFVLTDGTTTACQGDALRFDADGRIGTLSEPHKLSFGATGIDDHGAARVSVYPNPTKDVFNVEGEGIRRVDVFNAFGQEVLVEETTKEAFRIDLSDKAAGVYMLRVVTESGVMTRQLVKE